MTATDFITFILIAAMALVFYWWLAALVSGDEG